MSDDLAEAERWLNRIVDGYRPPMETSMRPAGLVQEELSRLRAVEQAARELREMVVDRCVGCRMVDGRLGRLLDGGTT